MGDVKLILYEENHSDKSTNIHDVLLATLELCQDNIFIINEFSNDYGYKFRIPTIQSKKFNANISTHYSIIINFIEKGCVSTISFYNVLNKIKNTGASFDIGYIFDIGLIYDMNLNNKTKINILNKYMILKQSPMIMTEKILKNI